MVEVPDVKDGSEEDNGPSEHQFDTLLETEEITSTSGMVTPINPQDLTEEILQAIQKIVGDDLEDEDPLNAAAIIEPSDDGPRDKPLKELSTVGFFSMAFPEVFVNSTCD